MLNANQWHKACSHPHELQYAAMPSHVAFPLMHATRRRPRLRGRACLNACDGLKHFPEMGCDVAINDCLSTARHP